MEVDDLDLRLVRAMGFDPYGRVPRPPTSLKPAALAQRVGVTAETVQARLKRLEEQKVLRGYEIWPNFRHLGLEVTCYYLRLADDAAVDRAIQDLQPVDGIYDMCGMVAGELCVNVSYRSPGELERRLRLLATIAGQGELCKFCDLAMPPVDRPLSHLDWAIIKALRGNALRRLDEVADELKVSAKTVKRRFDRMGAEGSFVIVPRWSLGRAPGVIPFNLVVTLDAEAPASVRTDLARLLHERALVEAQVASRQLGNVAYMVAATRLDEVDQLRRAAAAVRGVAKARALMMRSFATDFRWLDEAIAQQMALAAPLAPVPA